jgi:hypothetical protein
MKKIKDIEGVLDRLTNLRASVQEELVSKLRETHGAQQGILDSTFEVLSALKEDENYLVLSDELRARVEVLSQYLILAINNSKNNNGQEKTRTPEDDSNESSEIPEDRTSQS